MMKHGWQNRFLEALRERPVITDACKIASISRRMAYTEREKKPEFATQWKEALELSIRSAEDIAWRRALDDSDKLLMFMLRAHKPKRYGDKVDVELNGKLTFDEIIDLANQKE